MNLVGKKVRLITDSPRFGLGSVRKGDIGVIVKQVDNPFDSKELVIRFPNHHAWNGVMSDIKLVGASNNREALQVTKLDSEY